MEINDASYRALVDDYEKQKKDALRNAERNYQVNCRNVRVLYEEEYYALRLKQTNFLLRWTVYLEKYLHDNSTLLMQDRKADNSELKALLHKKNVGYSNARVKYDQEKTYIENQYTQKVEALKKHILNEKKQIQDMANRYYSGEAVRRITMQLAHGVNEGFKCEDSRNHIKIISTKLAFQVINTAIYYRHKSLLKTPLGNSIEEKEYTYDFVVEGINPIQGDVACQALAQAVMQSLKDIYIKKHSNGNVKCSRTIYTVEMEFSKVNKNYVAPINI